GIDCPGTGAEYFTNIFIGGKIDIALAIALLDVRESAVLDQLAVDFLLLDNRQWTDSLCQHLQFDNRNTDFSGTGTDHRAASLDKVAQVEVTLKHVIGFLADCILTDKQLDLAC